MQFVSHRALIRTYQLTVVTYFVCHFYGMNFQKSLAARITGQMNRHRDLKVSQDQTGQTLKQRMPSASFPRDAKDMF